MQFFLNYAVYLKVGQNLWVDHKFSAAVLSGIYHLHASTSGWVNFFNDTYGTDCVTLSHHQVQAAFVYESIRQASEMSGIDFIIRDVVSIDEVTEEAFTVLGHEGLIQPARGHACAECYQPYRATSDVILTPNNPSAVLGVDPVVASTVVQSGSNNPAAQNSVQMQNHCAYDSCTSDLANYQGGAFCQVHEYEFGNQC
ncbi:hypothetical protein CVT25_006599, partial [Psilocybe cyanescens]